MLQVVATNLRKADVAKRAIALDLDDLTEEEMDQFKLLNSGVDNVLFFKTKLKDPVKLSLNIMDDIISCGEQKTKFLLRFVPIGKSSY